MGLKKSIALSTGEMGEYISIVEVNMNKMRKDARISFCLYKNKDLRDLGVSPLTGFSIDINSSNPLFDFFEPSYLNRNNMDPYKSAILLLKEASNIEGGVVDPVEARDAVLDKDGKEIVPAVEAVQGTNARDVALIGIRNSIPYDLSGAEDVLD